jgi:hypothetical protein
MLNKLWSSCVKAKCVSQQLEGCSKCTLETDQVLGFRIGTYAQTFGVLRFEP